MPISALASVPFGGSSAVRPFNALLAAAPAHKPTIVEQVQPKVVPGDCKKLYDALVKNEDRFNNTMDGNIAEMTRSTDVTDLTRLLKNAQGAYKRRIEKINEVWNNCQKELSPEERDELSKMYDRADEKLDEAEKASAPPSLPDATRAVIQALWDAARGRGGSAIPGRAPIGPVFVP